MKTILVNATALKTGGALTILKEFISHIPANNQHIKYIIFISIADLSIFKVNAPNVILDNRDIQTWSARIKWDYFGISKWCRKNKLIPDLVISLQSTGVNISKDIPQLIYYHQPMPLFDYQWSPFIRRERKLWFYKNIFPFLVKIFKRKNTQFIVQLHCIKMSLSKNLGISLQNIHVFRPNVSRIDVDKIALTPLSGKFNILYPASAMVYKNHMQIAKALAYLKINKHNIEDIKVYFTSITEENMPDVANYITQNNLQDNFKFLGLISYTELLSLYKSCDLIVFPSYVETFGLPLIESANFGKKIIAADEEYAREVLANYPGAEFVATHDTPSWAGEIWKNYQHPSSYAEFAESTESWPECFSLITGLVGIKD